MRRRQALFALAVIGLTIFGPMSSAHTLDVQGTSTVSQIVASIPRTENYTDRYMTVPYTVFGSWTEIASDGAEHVGFGPPHPLTTTIWRDESIAVPPGEYVEGYVIGYLPTAWAGFKPLPGEVSPGYIYIESIAGPWELEYNISVEPM